MIVVLPFCEKDRHLAEKNLEWCVSLDGPVDFKCLLSYERGTQAERVAELATLYFGAGNVTRFVYDRHIGESKWPQPQNYAFQSTARHIHANYKDSWFWWESDAVPLKPGWIASLQSEYQAMGKPFMGSIVEGFGYMAGVAVYPWNLADFTERALLTRAAPWDVAMGPEMLGSAHRANHLIHHIRSEEATTFGSMEDLKEIIPPGAVIFHKCKDGSLIEGLRGNLGSRPRAFVKPKRKTCIVQLGRYGDILNMLPIAKWVHDRYDKPVMMVSKDFIDILDGVSYVEPVIYDGHYGTMTRAIEEAKERFDYVIVSQVWGNDGYQVERSTDAYNLESWRIAGFIDKWNDQQFRLVIDRRDEQAEASLVKQYVRCGKPLMLLNVSGGNSSPFRSWLPFQCDIMTRWAAHFEIVDISSIRARHVYDLLGLFDKASLLVTSDTSTLHLAAASKVKVIALTNDEPWKGSATRCRTICKLKYNEVMIRMEEVHKAIFETAGFMAKLKIK